MTLPVMRGVHTPLRWLAAALLIANALIHLYLTPAHLVEAPYIGVLFVLLSVACLVLAAAIGKADSTLTWSLVAAVNLLALIGLLASRTVGLPRMADDVGAWSDPLATATIVLEVAMIIAATLALRRTAPSR